MSRTSWKNIRSTAAPETIARAELKTAAILASLDQQDRSKNESTNPAGAGMPSDWNDDDSPGGKTSNRD
jgi:hypothetical protein